MSLVCHVCSHKIKILHLLFSHFSSEEGRKSSCHVRVFRWMFTTCRSRSQKTSTHRPTSTIRCHSQAAQTSCRTYSQTIILSHNRVSRQVLYNYIIFLLLILLIIILIIIIFTKSKSWTPQTSSVPAGEHKKRHSQSPWKRRDKQ